MKGLRFLGGAAAAALVTSPASAQPASPQAASAPAVIPACAGAPEERAALEAERSALDRAIGDIALGKRKKRKASGGEVAAGVAGAAASVILPFGIGALLGAGAKAAASGGRKKRPAAPAADVPAMVDRLGIIEARLAELAACA